MIALTACPVATYSLDTVASGTQAVHDRDKHPGSDELDPRLSLGSPCACCLVVVARQVLGSRRVVSGRVLRLRYDSGSATTLPLLPPYRDK